LPSYTLRYFYIKSRAHKNSNSMFQKCPKVHVPSSCTTFSYENVPCLAQFLNRYIHERNSFVLTSSACHAYDLVVATCFPLITLSIPKGILSSIPCLYKFYTLLKIIQLLVSVVVSPSPPRMGLPPPNGGASHIVQ